MSLELTNGQKAAIKEYGKNIIVSAGAGSGKTFVLTERVIYFIKEHGFRLSDFLILTFTNLAAGEMKDRIRKKLKSNNLPDAAFVDTSDICTFDSYALALVKKYHFLLGVSANISIVDSNIISVRKRTIINDLFEEMYKLKDTEFLNLIDRFCFNDDEEIRTFETTEVIGGLTVVAASGKAVEIKSAKATFTHNGTEYSVSKAISLGGSAKFGQNRYIELEVDKACQVTIVAKSSGSSDRTLDIRNSSNTSIANADAKASLSITTIDIDNAGTYMIGSTGSGIYVYAIIVEYFD